MRSLLRRRFARAQVATSRNVGCFLRLHEIIKIKIGLSKAIKTVPNGRESSKSIAIFKKITTFLNL